MIRFDATSLRSRIARRMFGVFVVCALMPFAGLVLVSHRQVTNFFHQNNQRQLRTLVKTFGLDTYERLLLLEAGLQIIAGTIESSGSLPSEERLDSLASNPKARWEGLAVVTASGKRHQLFGPVEPFPELTGKERAHLTSGKALVFIRPGAAGGTRIFMGLALGQAPMKGLVIGEIKPGYLWNLAGSRALPAYIKPCAFEVTGIALMCSFADSELAAALLRHMGNSALGDFHWTEHGISQQASYWTIPIKFEFQTSEWIVVLLATKEGIFTSISELRETFVLWTVVCLGLSLLLAIHQIRRRLVPVEKLHDATRRIAKNDFDIRVEIQSADEFQELAASFNAMAAQLGHQFNTLNTTADIQRAVLSLLETSKVTGTILARMMAVLGCDCATATLFGASKDQPESTYIVRLHAGGNSPPPAGLTRSFAAESNSAAAVEVTSARDAGLISRRAADGQSLLTITDLRADADFRGCEWIHANRFTSCLAAPLMVKSRSFGGMTFYSINRRLFTDKDIAFVTALTSEAALAIYNSQLYERTTRQAEELILANRVKDEFLAVMSHELRTPINVILGYMTMVQDQVLGEINPDQARALAIVTKHSRDLLAMIERIIDVANLESGASVVDWKHVTLPDLVEQLQSQYASPLEKEIELVWNCPPDLPSIKTDPSKLKRIIHNLVDNAIKFTQKGRVTVSLRAAEHGSVALEVADTGMGIPKRALPTLFRKFRQLDSSAARQHEGIGLGLYIVKRLSNLIGAQIEVESEVGVGTTFKLTLSPAAADSDPPNDRRELPGLPEQADDSLL